MGLIETIFNGILNFIFNLRLAEYWHFIVAMTEVQKQKKP